MCEYVYVYANIYTYIDVCIYIHIYLSSSLAAS